MKIYHVLVDATWNKKEERLTIYEYDLYKDNPKTLIGIHKGSEKRFLKSELDKVKRTHLAPITWFSFFTDDAKKINQILESALNQSLLLLEHNQHKIETDTTKIKELISDIGGES